MHSGHGTKIHFLASYVASLCTMRLGWAQHYSVTRAKPYPKSDLELNSSMLKPTDSPTTGLRSMWRPIHATLPPIGRPG